MNKLKLYLILALYLSIIKIYAANPTPTLIPFQGRLTDANGVAVSNGVRLAQFKIYNVPAGGSPVWPGEIHRTTVNGGLVNVLLGSKVSLDKIDFSQTLYLEITVDSNGDNAITATDPPMLPRQIILPAAFAKNSQKLAGYDWSSILTEGNDPTSGRLKIAPGIINGIHIQDHSISPDKLTNFTTGLEMLGPNAKEVLAVIYRKHVNELMNGFIDPGTLKTNLGILKDLAGDAWNTTHYLQYKSYLESLNNNTWRPVPGVDYLILNLGLKLKWIPSGSFTMGSPASEGGGQYEGPLTKVNISRGFWIGQYEVTQKQYQQIIGSNPSKFQGDEEDNQRPVEMVSYIDATIFCAKLTDIERLANRLPQGYIYRLPTEAEWEYCCRAGTTTRFWYGDDQDYSLLTKYAWYDGNSLVGDTAKTHPVGLKSKNPWELYDMHGNVFEWCKDGFDFNGYPGTEVTDYFHSGSSGSRYIIRGGAWYSSGSYCRSAMRGTGMDTEKYHHVGIRVSLAPEIK